MKNLKVVICLAWALAITISVVSDNAIKTSGQTTKPPAANYSIVDAAKVDRFNRIVQQRFLTEPMFGIRRMMPTTPEPLESAHLSSFSPVNDEERLLVNGFQTDRLRASLYLFGRRSDRIEDKEGKLKEFRIRYRINQAVPITAGLREKDLPDAKGLARQMKAAFEQFQTAKPSADERYEFTKGKWSFVARPVLAVNDSCVKCHTDYVPIERVGDGQFKFRKRAVGDVNGVIVYAFAEVENK